MAGRRGPTDPAGVAVAPNTWGRWLARLSRLFAVGRLRHFNHPVTVAAGSWLVLVILIAPIVTRPSLRLEPGQVSPVDVEASRTIENRYRTQQLEQEAVKSALRRAAEDPANYAIDPTASVQAGDRVRKAMGLIRAEHDRLHSGAGSRDGAAGGPSTSQVQARVEPLRQAILEQAGLSLPAVPLAEALRLDRAVLSAAVAAAPEVAEQVMAVTRIGAGDVDPARRQLADAVAGLKLPPQAASLASVVGSAAVMPNLILDPARIERLRQEAIRSVTPVMVLQHQVILRRGDIVTEEHVQLLADLGLLGPSGQFWSQLLGVGVLLGIVVGAVALFVARFHPEIASSPRLSALLAAIALAAVVAGRLLQQLPWAMAGSLTPVALSGMLATLLLDARLGAGIVATLSVLVGLMFGFGERYLILALVTGMAAVFNVHSLGQRSDLTRTGVVAGVAGFVTLGALGLLRADTEMVAGSWAGLANGLLSSVLALGLLPFFEATFGTVSTVRLMELSNPNQPLLRRLLLEAPGTYHHSLMVGNLAETAAEAVRADPVLCRTGALYHDIGKVRRPYFFVENQFGDANPHERLTPSLSTLIIMSHVKDGVELARQAKLPEAVIDFIRTHHGTDLVRFFYARAIQAEGAANVDEREYRYPGPKPHSKETAIVMLADVVEAAVRALSHPSPGRIEGLVRKGIRERLLDGQLDESTLTLHELNDIAQAFTKVLTGVYHVRVEYPELVREVQGRRA